MTIESQDQAKNGKASAAGLSPERVAKIGTATLDPRASAALAQAVLSARKADGTLPASKSSDEQRLQLPKQDFFLGKQLLIHSALILILAGSCWVAAYAGTFANRSTLDQIAAETAQNRASLARLDHNIETLNSIVGALKTSTEKASDTDAVYRQTWAKDVERISLVIKEPGERLSALEARIDRMEQQITVAIAALAVKPESAPVTPVSLPVPQAAAKPELKSIVVRAEPVDGWVLREVYNGAALIESRNRRLFEVVPGGMVPGVGRVEAIERRGGRWVVATDKGIISAYR